MLNGTLTLHDIRDVEAFCTRIAEGPLRQHDTHRQEDLIAYLIEECWLLSTRYQPGGITFSTWARATLQRRIHDHLRKRDGRTRWQFADTTHQRERPTILSLDDPLGNTQPTTHRDPPPDRTASDLVRLLRTRSSDEAWRADIHRTKMQGRAA